MLVWLASKGKKREKEALSWKPKKNLHEKKAKPPENSEQK